MNTEPNEPADTPKPAPGEADPHFDQLLQHLVAFANVVGVGPQVTLNVGGVLITGTLVGGRQYFEAIAAQMLSTYAEEEGQGIIEMLGSAVAKGLAEGFAEAFTAVAEQYPSPSLTVLLHPEQLKSVDPPVYIHLADADLLTAGHQGQWSIGEGRLWRGKLAAVDGFFFGAIE